MLTAVQGIVAAGAVAHLTREPTWEKMTLAVNHLLFLVGTAFLEAHVQNPVISPTSKIVFILTPILLLPCLIVDQEQRNYRRVEEDSPGKVFQVRFSLLYHVAAGVCAFVLGALGHRTYAVGFFAVTGLDVLTRVNHEVKKFFDGLSAVPAFLSFWSYGLNLRTQTGVQLMLFTALEVFVPKIYRFFNPAPYSGSFWRSYYSSRPSSSSSEEEKSQPVPPPSDKRNFPEIANLMGPLPHML